MSVSLWRAPQSMSKFFMLRRLHWAYRRKMLCTRRDVRWASSLSHRGNWGHTLKPLFKGSTGIWQPQGQWRIWICRKRCLLDKIHNETRILKDPSYFCLNSLQWRLQKTFSEKQTTYVVFLKEKAIYFIHYPPFLSHLFFILFPAKASKSQEK